MVEYFEVLCQDVHVRHRIRRWPSLVVNVMYMILLMIKTRFVTGQPGADFTKS